MIFILGALRLPALPLPLLQTCRCFSCLQCPSSSPPLGSVALVLSIFLECFSVQISVLSLPFLSQASLFDESCFDASVCKFYNKGKSREFPCSHHSAYSNHQFSEGFEVFSWFSSSHILILETLLSLSNLQGYFYSHDLRSFCFLKKALHESRDC